MFKVVQSQGVQPQWLTQTLGTEVQHSWAPDRMGKRKFNYPGGLKKEPVLSCSPCCTFMHDFGDINHKGRNIEVIILAQNSGI